MFSRHSGNHPPDDLWGTLALLPGVLPCVGAGQQQGGRVASRSQFVTSLPLITRWGRAGLGTLLLTLAAFCASDAGPKRVLVLDPFGRDIAPFSAAVSAFRTALAQEFLGPVDICKVPVDLARFVVASAGVPCERNEALRRLHQVANAPLFGYFASEFGLGTIGGWLYQDSETGLWCDRTALRSVFAEHSTG